ncbi:DUF1707 domain-containing protein [Lentzea sp. BCCO 10_0798]|uniref:DUF1707 domain-containing protein n=1 Tax=Lentzea kristufekii TaxID=3095430 RepID=A0ABU4TM69_9PSEU|nr:DUF1707 domain-containing protein [Lentzea sp. BCCO 10_0798]MDX8049375.1 DUF1707 domain-containing protein [Lentzea sp. BCCO 10_0798]
MSDAEREHVVTLLNKAVGRGMITLDEFTVRTDTALGAKTRADLNVVLLDLPGMVNNELARERTELKNTMSTTTRKGHWVVPNELVIRNTLGTTNLDFTAAEVPPVVNVDLDVSLGTVKLLLPAGSSVNADAVEVTAGELKDKVQNTTGNPHFQLKGSVRGGTVVIKRSKR